MNRRNFLSSLGVTISSLPATLIKAKADSADLTNECIKGFIVSDAHIGWNNKQQPKIEEQLAACKKIQQRFSDLDLYFDTGDAHHGSLNEAQRKQARGLWLKNIANQFPTTPFHYIPGNHELGKGETDPEKVACQLGSLPFRPYYSFDYKGIHFISLPQLFNTIFITQETINWLLLDLLVNQHKSTLIFSHNSIKGTTFTNDETGYRCLANSEQVMSILDQNPQILAWFHGHNHQYEVVNKNNKLFVSNGRIGGFNPPARWGDFGQGNLGGIYFEVKKDQLSVRAYSATADQFFDQMGAPHLSQTIAAKTSIDPAGKFNFYFGHGASTAGISYAYNNHYLSTQPHQITHTKVDNNINEHPALNLPTHYVFGNKRQIKMIGYQFSDRSVKFSSENSDLRVHNKAHLSQFALSFPNHLNKKTKLYKRGSYYRCANDQNYALNVQLGELQTPIKLLLTVTYLDELYQPVFQTMPITPEQQNNQQYNFHIPHLTADMPFKSVAKYFRFEVGFEQTPESFLIKQIDLRPQKNDSNQPELYYLNEPLKLKGELIKAAQKVNPASSFSGEVLFQQTGDNMLAWLAKIPAVKWQARNATIKQQDGYICLDRSIDSICSVTQSVVTPTTKLAFFPNVFEGVKSYRFKINNNQLNVIIDQLESHTFFTVVALNGHIQSAQATIQKINPHTYHVTPSQQNIMIDYVQKA